MSKKIQVTVSRRVVIQQSQTVTVEVPDFIADDSNAAHAAGLAWAAFRADQIRFPTVEGADKIIDNKVKVKHPDPVTGEWVDAFADLNT